MTRFRAYGRGMSPESSPRTAAATPRERMISGPLALVFVSSFATLTSFYLLLSVTPRYIAKAGSGTAGAGLVTGALLLGTVAASAGLMKRTGTGRCWPPGRR